MTIGHIYFIPLFRPALAAYWPMRMMEFRPLANGGVNVGRNERCDDLIAGRESIGCRWYFIVAISAIFHRRIAGRESIGCRWFRHTQSTRRRNVLTIGEFIDTTSRNGSC